MFYKDKNVLLDEKDEIFLIRTKKNQLFLDHYHKEEDVRHKILEEDCNKDFYVSYDYLGNMNIVYRNTENKLILNTLINKESHSIVVEELHNNIYYLNLVATDILNVFYVEESDKKNLLYIVHLTIEGDKVVKNIVDTIVNYNLVMPIQIRHYRENLIVFYYFRNVICLKVLDCKKGLWEHPVTLTDNRNKLYLDTKIIGDEIHLSYSIFKDDNFYINYEKFSIDDNYIVKKKEIKISSNGNHTNPLLIRYKSRIYIVWRESNRILSTYSNDKGHTWTDIREFNDVKKMDIVKYKYLTKGNMKNREIDYSYGSTDPIEFIGF